MITKELTYKRAFENKKKRLNEKQNQREAMLASAYVSNPRLSEIDRELSVIGASLAITALSGDKKKLSELKRCSKLLSAEKNDIIKRAQVPDIKYECSCCLDTGYIGGKICECIKREAGAVMIAELSREMPLGNCRFDNFDLKYYSDKTDSNGKNPRRRMTAILKLCREYALSFDVKNSKNLLFSGSAGLGKTHLTMAIVAGVIEKGFLPVYGTADNLFTAIENEKFSGEGKGTYESVLNCDLLVIDDLGTELTTAFTKSVLYNLVNTRILSGKPTIINTNLEIEEIQKRYEPRIASRFMGEYEWQKFIGNDIRLQKALNK